MADKFLPFTKAYDETPTYIRDSSIQGFEAHHDEVLGWVTKIYVAGSRSPVWVTEPARLVACAMVYCGFDVNFHEVDK